jgi:hypothetical protein
VTMQLNNFIDSDDDDDDIVGSWVSFFFELNTSNYLHQNNVCTNLEFETFADIIITH